MVEQIKYRGGYKYQLYEDYQVLTDIRSNVDVESPGGFVELLGNGNLFIKKGYAWDGPSGPAFDTKNFMRGSLCHDACYQLLREGLLEPEKRILADKLMRRVCREDGMSWIRAWWCYQGVRLGAKRSSTTQGMRRVITAP